MTKKINIADEFSRTPAGRYESDGPYSGELFRNKWLIPALNDNDYVEVELDGLLSSGSSFLEEAFGGLVRAGVSGDTIHKKLRIKSRLKTYEVRIWKYIDDEANGHRA